MQARRLTAFCFAATLAIPSCAQSSNDPVVTFAIGTKLTLATSSGQVAREIHLKHPVYDFALSKDRKQLVTVSPDTETGGNLSLLDLQTQAQIQLTNGHLYFKAKDLNKGETEVYEDPQFSPDGRSLTFAIHTDNPGDGNDAINDSGPIAVMEMKTRKVRVLKSTENIDGQGFCFANTPMWSPDGKWILFNCEAGGFITDVRGTTLRDLKLGTDQDPNAYAVSWVGNSCVLFVQSHTTNGSLDPSKDEVFLYNLRTSSSQKLASWTALPSWRTAGLREASESVFILESHAGRTIETKGKEWTFPATQRVFSGHYSWKAPAAHIIGGWQVASIPHGCE